ncbi:DUF4150 domain-containing protein [Paraliomyxa miuraensis]|uniref:DUF4150 domain-containing protein n=1 Tax=Paraliomyxa miuraensis TaxID=376150 RepID=UPI002252C458|nr:DUF4150 domain-containing protein [Paraliomyxa miuraensis]MCX4241807.1 DUF4150 domain-containing protein [Paraliomyxa miuraensis]
MSSVYANGRTILHKGDGLTQTSGPPDVCKTPSPGGPVPIPYPNVAMDSDLAKGAKKVKIENNPVALASSNLSTSTGDEAGTAGGGIISSKTKGKLTFGSSSLDMIVEGKGVARFMDVTQHNDNTFNTVLAATGAAGVAYGDDPIDQEEHGPATAAATCRCIATGLFRGRSGRLSPTSVSPAFRCCGVRNPMTFLSRNAVR